MRKAFQLETFISFLLEEHWRMIEFWLATMLRKIPFSIGFYDCMADFAVKKGTAMVAWKSFKHASVFQGLRIFFWFDGRGMEMEHDLFCSVGILEVTLLSCMVH